MIEKWLGRTPLDEFRSSHYQRMPLAQPDSARDAAAYLTWQTFADLLTAPTSPDVMIVREGRLLDLPAPRTREEFMNLFGAGCSFVIREAERHDPGIRQVADGFAADLGGLSTVQVFVTPPESHGFGWHYDCEEVFIAQTSGTKEYFLRQNTVNPEPTVDAMPRDMQYPRETSQVIACTLAAGDLLYIPRGWWHMGRALEPSLGISVGVLSEAARGSLSEPEALAIGRHAGYRS